MTYAIIETGGKQLRVEPGRFYDIELLSAEPDETVTLETVLLVQHNGDVTIGQPFVDGATVEGKVMRHLRGRKVIVYKMKPKKKTRKKRGHRQEITRLMINSISLNGSVLTSEADATTLVADADAVEVAAETIPETTDEPATAVTSEVASEGAPETADEPATAVTEPEAESQS
jgi:large subunit ribosomal protein L21